MSSNAAATRSPLAAHSGANHYQQQRITPSLQERDAAPGGNSNSLYPQPQPTFQNPNTQTVAGDSPHRYTDDDVRANTLANSYSNQAHHADGYLHPYARRDSHTQFPLHQSSIANQHPNNSNINNNGKFKEEWDASQRGSSIIDGHTSKMQRSNSFNSSAGEDHLNFPSRGNTLKKKNSLRRNASLKRSGSRRSMKAGSVRSLALQSGSDPDEFHSALHCPVPTTGNPTEGLANRFQSWRKILKDLISYYREIQNHYEHKSKSLLKLANVANNIAAPPGFMTSGGIDDALNILRTYHKSSILEANKARDIEEDVILALTGLRSDLQQKIKEIKSLSGDFKNGVDREMDSTRKAIKTLQDTLGQSDADPASTTGKQDPYLLRLAVDRQVERQIDEENYLHQAYLNIEASGRELESIVVGEIQKAYNAYAGILKRESDAAYNAIDELRIGPISIPKDREWTHFVQKDDHFVDPEIAVRSAEKIHYPGQDHVACQEMRAGLLERKSKYLKSYTAGWYVLSPTHLHEFKSADKAQAPIMSLYLPEQKLGSHSSEGGSSNKFILKGRQAGSMHRGHTWVFRAETHDTMMAWYEDIRALTEKTPQERTEFVRGHVRSLSQSSRRSTSSDGVLDDEDDEPFSAENIIDTGSKQDVRRPQPGGRFPSDIQVNAQRGLQAPLSPSSVSSGNDNQDRNAPVAGGMVLGSGLQANDHNDNITTVNHNNLDPYNTQGYGDNGQQNIAESPTHAAVVAQQAREDGVNPYTSEPIQQRQSRSRSREPALDHHQQYQQPQHYSQNVTVPVPLGETTQLQNQLPRDDQQSLQNQQQNELNGAAHPPVAPIMVDTDTRRLNSATYDDGVLETPGGNGQYGTWLNRGDQQGSVDAYQQNGPNGDMYYSSGGRSQGDVTVAPMVAASTRNYAPEQETHGYPIAGQRDMSTASPIPLPVPNQQSNYTTSPLFPEADVPQQEQQSQVRPELAEPREIRPTSTNVRTTSVPTISNLHVPGEYPKSTPTAETFGERP